MGDGHVSNVEDVLPLTPLQEGQLFHAEFDEAGPNLYTAYLSAELSGPLDVAVLRSACAQLLARHQSLRACFRQDRANQVVQVVRREVPLLWRQVDLSGCPEDECAERLDRLTAAARADRFDLTKAPLIRFMLVRLAPEDHRFIMTNHHAVLDGWSTSVVLAELAELYERRGDASGLPTPPPCRDYYRWLAKQDRDAAKNAWQDALTGLAGPTLLAPSDPDRWLARPDQFRVELPRELVDRLKGFARGRGLTLNTLFQGALGLALGCVTGQSDVVFGATVTGRPPEVPGIENMVGMFINTVPVRVRQQLSRAERLVAMLARLQGEQSRLIAHHYLGLVDIRRAAGQAELFDTHLAFQNFPWSGEASGFPLSGIKADMSTNYSLSVVVQSSGDAISVDVEHRPGVVDRRTAEAVAGGMVRVLETVVAAPDMPVSRVEVLRAEDRRAVLELGEGSAVEADAVSVPELFAARAAATPESAALVCGDVSLSYRELSSRVNRLAHRLVAAGVGPEDPVAVLLPRSADSVVALLGVLAAGAMYVCRIRRNGCNSCWPTRHLSW